MTVADPQRAIHDTPAVLALGSNLGDRRATLEHAVEDLRATPGIIVTAVSETVESVAVTTRGEDPEKPAYLNGVVLVRSLLTPEELLAATGAIEDAHGRERTERWGDRTLDIDIIVFGDEERSDPELALPHPRLAERAFVLDPWFEVDPDAVVPGLGPVARLREKLRGERAS